MACWPTAEEASAPGFNLSVWRGLWVPKDTPKPVIAKLNAAVGDALGAPAVKKALADIGQDIPVPEEQTAQTLGAFQSRNRKMVADHQGREYQSGMICQSPLRVSRYTDGRTKSQARSDLTRKAT